MHTLKVLLTKHTTAPFDTELITKARRSDRVGKHETARSITAGRQYLCISPRLYNKVNRNINVYPLTLTKCEVKLTDWLYTLSYEDADNIIKVVCLNIYNKHIHTHTHTHARTHTNAHTHAYEWLNSLLAYFSCCNIRCFLLFYSIDIFYKWTQSCNFYSNPEVDVNSSNADYISAAITVLFFLHLVIVFNKERKN